MSTSITKQGILKADGLNIGENIAWNSSLRKDHSLWGVGGTWDHTIKDGYPCIHHTGAFKTTGTLTPKQTFNTTTDGMLPYNGLILTFSCYVLLEDIVKGTTNYYLALYPSGQTINGTWRSAVVLKNNGYFTTSSSVVLDPEKLNGKGWTFVSCTFQWGDYAWSNTNYKMQVYARDYTGEFYVRDVKFEQNDFATPWTPNPNDDLYTGEHGFFEESNIASIGKGYFNVNEFYEL